MKITEDWIRTNKSERDGWNFSQIALLGESWPPRKGWIQRAVGRDISDEDAALFVEYAKNRPTGKQRRLNKLVTRQQQRLIRRDIRREKFTASDSFLESYEWRRVRMVVLKRDGARCACCGATPADGVRMNVDHIKPRKNFPELALDPRNLQVLCEVCNHGKGNWDQTDWRVGEPANDSQEQQHLRSIMEV